LNATEWDEAEITAKGRKFTIEAVSTKGGADRPVSQAELVKKFRVNASYSLLKSSRVKGLVGLLLRLDRPDDITKLCETMTIS